MAILFFAMSASSLSINFIVAQKGMASRKAFQGNEM